MKRELALRSFRSPSVGWSNQATPAFPNRRIRPPAIATLGGANLSAAPYGR